MLQILQNEVENRERCKGVNALAQKEKTYSPEDWRNNWKLEPPTHIRTIKLTEAIDCKQSSNATKLFRGTALSLKFIRDLKAARTWRREPQNTKPTLTVEEISEARSQWIRKLQEPMKHEKNFENLKQQLGLFRKEGNILKCKGRLGNAPLDITASYPIQSPRRHHVTRQIMEAIWRKRFISVLSARN